MESHYTAPEAKTYICPACGAALRFDAAKSKIVCTHCGTEFSPTEIPKESVAGGWKPDAADYMDCSVWRCTTCGGRLVADSLETSTFCPYCARPTIIFDRVDKQLRPKKIIPFKVTRRDAEQHIRERLKGFFVPRDIQNFSAERIAGVYIPYWLCDMDYKDNMYLHGTVNRGKRQATKYFFRSARCAYANISMDASKRLNDETSQRLEPFRMVGLMDFNPAYMSGFYADRYDVDSEQIESVAKQRAYDLFFTEVCKTIRASHITVDSSMPTYTIQSMTYVLMPVWFLTFRYAGKPYTFLVNGQTGKVVGAVPYSKAAFWGLTALLSCLLLPLCFSAAGFALDVELPLGHFLGITGAIALGFWQGARRFLHRLHEAIELTRSDVMMKFVRRRQKGGRQR